MSNNNSTFLKNNVKGLQSSKERAKLIQYLILNRVICKA